MFDPNAIHNAKMQILEGRLALKDALTVDALYFDFKYIFGGDIFAAGANGPLMWMRDRYYKGYGMMPDLRNIRDALEMLRKERREA